MARNVIRIAAAFVVSLGSAAWALELGDKAPELEPSAWAQGAPLKIADGAGKSVFVIEFVSTFKPECQTAIAAASKLQEKNRAKGIEVIAVSTETPAEVKAYLAEHASPLRFACDEDHNTNAAFLPENTRVPYAVVVDKSGAVVFQGDPKYGMEKLVEDVLAGKYDLKKALEVTKLRRELDAALAEDKYDEANPLCDRILALDVTDSYAFERRCDGFERKDDLDGFKKFVKAHLEHAKDDAKALSSAAIHILNLDRWNWRDPDMAISAARRAVELGKSAEADAVDTYAYVLGETGMLEQAVEQARKAVALDAKDESYKQRLSFLESCLALKKKLQPGTPPKK